MHFQKTKCKFKRNEKNIKILPSRIFEFQTANAHNYSK